MDKMKAIHTLEFEKILALLQEEASCLETKDRVMDLEPTQEPYLMERSLAETTDAKRLTDHLGSPPLGGVRAVGPMLNRAEKGGVLNFRELLAVCAVLRVTRNLKEYRGDGSKAGDTVLDPLFAALVPNRHLEDVISSAILSEEEMADAASSELMSIRRQMRSTSAKIREILQKVIRSGDNQKFLQEPIVTVRGDRYVIPVKAENRSDIPGLVHDTSSSGATLFVEPMAVVEANNQLKMLAGREQQEIERILGELTGEVLEWQEALVADYKLILELDFAFAKAKLSHRMKATAPNVNKEGYVKLIHARHPLIEARRIVPTDIELGGAFDTLVITGPNTGGKTVALKTLGLFVIMAQCGLHIPAAEGSCVSLFRNILADIGDEQSIEQSLSTFSSHMTNIVEIVRQADDSTLVLLDELGAGTDPVEGAALAIAILERLRRQGAKIAATTHYSELKVYALETPGVENGSCEFDVETLRPTYKLLIGVPGKSNAFAISRRLGLDGAIVDRAAQLVGEDNLRFEDVLHDLEAARQKMEQDAQDAERLREEAERFRNRKAAASEQLELERERELTRAKEQGKALVERTKFTVNRILDELEALRKEKDKADFSQKLRDAKREITATLNKIDDEVSPVLKIPEVETNQRPLKAGDLVEIRGLGTRGTVLSPADKSGLVTVQAGIIKTKVKEGGLRLVQEEQVKKEKLRFVASDVDRSSMRVTTSLDLRGQNGEEATLELDKFLDNAALTGISEVTVVHGKGTGALRAAVQQYLRRNPHVKEFRLGRYGEGEDGVTIVTLK